MKLICKQSQKEERGFSLIEVTVASVVTTVGLMFLASLFTLAIGQNRMNKHHTLTTTLAQKKIEELMAIEKTDARLTIGGGTTTATEQTGYYDSVLVDDTGTVTIPAPAGTVPNYARYWQVQADPGGLDRTILISVRVVAQQASKGNAAEETTLSSIRSW